VPAIAVQHVHLAVAVGEHHQLGAERVDGMRRAVAEVVGQPEAVPAPGVAGRRCSGVDLADAGHRLVPFAISIAARWEKTMEVPIGLPPPG